MNKYRSNDEYYLYKSSRRRILLKQKKTKLEQKKIKKKNVIYFHENRLVQLFAIYNFDGHFFACLVVNAELDEAGLAFAQRFLQPVRSNEHVVGRGCRRRRRRGSIHCWLLLLLMMALTSGVMMMWMMMMIGRGIWLRRLLTIIRLNHYIRNPLLSSQISHSLYSHSRKIRKKSTNKIDFWNISSSSSFLFSLRSERFRWLWKIVSSVLLFSSCWELHIYDEYITQTKN